MRYSTYPTGVPRWVRTSATESGAAATQSGGAASTSRNGLASPGTTQARGSPLAGSKPGSSPAGAMAKPGSSRRRRASVTRSVQARRSYIADEIVWDKRFADVLTVDETGLIEADYANFDLLVANRAPDTPE